MMVDMTFLHNILTEKYTEAHLDALLQMIDRLHDAAVVGAVNNVATLDTRDLIGWLDDIIFTAEETIRELQEHTHSTAPSGRAGWSEN
ncbi:MAG: hypothetical protein HC915_04180 [Anaerolineae bacterium]|nr:hypothetical protein [Anaerolineae bacterium]